VELTARPPSRPANWPLLYTAVTITALATVLLELSLAWVATVIFHRSTLYPALGGLCFGAIAATFVSGIVYRQLGAVSLLAAVLAVMVLFLFTGQHWLYLAAFLPFCAAGFVLLHIARETAERAEAIDCFAFLGAAGGCLVLFLLFNTFGGPATVIAAAVLFASAAAIWFSLGGYKAGRIASVAAGLVLTMMVVANVKRRFVEVGRAHLAMPGDTTLTAILMALLPAALGSLLSGTVLPGKSRAWAAAFAGLGALLLAIAGLAPANARLLIAPAGFFLGVAMPALTRVVRRAASV
jgi:hypothetical protein